MGAGEDRGKKLRQNPDLVTFAKQQLLAKRDRLFSAQVEWLELLNQKRSKRGLRDSRSA